MTRRMLLVIAGLVIAAAVAGSLGYWIRENQRVRIEAASLPSRPPLAGFPPELAGRVTECEDTIRLGTGGIRPLADLGQLYQANGFLSEAAQCYRGLMVLQPGNPRWPYLLAGICADAGQTEEALGIWRQVAARAPEYLPAQLRIADVFLKLNRRDEASAAYGRVLAADPENPYALLGRARIDIATARWEDARRRLETAAARTNGSIGGDLLVSVYEHLGETDKAAKLRSRAKASGAYYAIPDPWTEEIYDYCYDDLQLTHVSGLALQAGNINLARHWLERAIAVSPHSMQANFQLGLLERQLGDAARARQLLEACTRFAPEFADGWAQLVDLLQAQGDFSAADRALTEGLRHCPRSPGLHLLRARKLAAAGTFDEAIVEFEKAARLRPEEADPFVALARIYFSLGRTEQAVESLHRALASEPEFPTAIAALALYSIGIGDEPAARDWMARARQQVRIPRAQVESLAERYRNRFGREPW